MTISQAIRPAPDPDFKFDQTAETMSRTALAEVQKDRLLWSLNRAYDNVAHYRRAFDAAGVKPQHLTSLGDLKHFLFTVKTDLRDNYPYDFFATPVHELARIHASSGTTGKPTIVGYTKGDLDRWADLMARSMAGAGVRPGDVLHNAYGYGLFTGGLGAHAGAQRLGCAVVPVSGGGTERQVSLLRDLGPSVLCSTPSYALNIAEVAEGMGVDIAALPVHRGLFGAEPWSNEMRAELDRRLGLKSVDVYGLSEIMGPGVACECDVARDGLHGWEDHFLFEVIDPETLEPLPMGEQGELVITTLTKEAMPMIRYRTRDITRLTDEPCACGRTHLRILRVTGRDDDGHLLVTKLFEIYGPPDLPESEEPKKKKRVPKPTRANNALKEANLPSGSTETLSIEELFEAGKGLHYSSPYVGTWVERSLAESASAIITTTLSPNGTFTAKAVLRSLEKGDCTTVRVRTSGRWIVDGQDVLLLVDETSEPDVIPVGFRQIRNRHFPGFAIQG